MANDFNNNHALFVSIDGVIALMYKDGTFMSIEEMKILRTELDKAINDKGDYSKIITEASNAAKERNERELQENNKGGGDGKAYDNSDLYFIKDTKTKLIKIGKSANVKSRLKTLQTAIGHKLVLIAEFKEMGYLEADIHSELASIRTHGEWFKDTHLLKEVIAELKN